MAGIIKSQILKHLSKFAKNLNSESINVSTWRGEGELKNLDLNEDVLTDLMELPTWLRLTKATVNKVSVKIQWTKLKSVPIELSLDEVVVVVETCPQLRPNNTTEATAASYTSGGHYGFSDKVIDGMTVSVNAVHVTFKSPVFTGVFQLSSLKLESRSPGWQKVVDLRMTRLKNAEKNMLLLFKELSWQSIRIEVKSNNPADEKKNFPPIRLITNACHCRITIKKKITDCSVVGCRLVILLDDLLWVLTDSQLISACHFAQSLTDLVKQATQQSHKVKAVRKLESLPDGAPGAKDVPHSSSPASNVFNKFDVIETSYHFVCKQIDLHLCDDPGSGRSSHPSLAGGASLQVSLKQLRIDYYPYHLATGDRKHWIRYNDCGPQTICQGSLVHFRNALVEALSGSQTKHTPLSRAPPHTPQQGGRTTNDGSRAPPPDTSGTTKLKSTVNAQMRKLMVSCCVLSVGDFTVYRVTTAKRKHPPKEFVSTSLRHQLKSAKSMTGDRDRICLPNDPSSVHIEFLNFYYPGESDFPVPCPAVYGNISPLKVVLDLLSVIWVNAFGRALQLSVLPDPSLSPPQYLDMHVQFIMPRVVLEASPDHHFSGHQRDRPRGLQVLSSRVTLSNFRPPDPSAPGSLVSLASTLEQAQTGGELFFASGFPATSQDSLPVSTKFVRHALGEDNVREVPNFSGVAVYDAIRTLSRESLWTEARDLLFLHCEPVWVEFTGTPSSKSRPLPFVDPFPISVWIHLKMPGVKDGVPRVAGAVDEYSPVHTASASALPPAQYTASPGDTEGSVRCASARVKREKSIGRKEAGLNVLVHCLSLVSCQLNHFQYLFLMRQLDMITELSAFLTCDTRVIYQGANEDRKWVKDIEDSLVISAIVPQVDISFIIPPLHPSKDSAMGDMEGFVPDSSSTVGEMQEIDSLKEIRASNSDHSIDQRTQSYQPNANLLVDNVTIPSDFSKSQSDGHLSSEANSPHLPGASRTASQRAGASSQPMPTVNLVAPPTGSTGSVNANPLDPSNKHTSLSVGIMSVKKGFSSLMTTFETSVKATSPDDYSDTISIQSDLSSDSENFLLVNMETNVLGEGSDSGLGMENAFRADASRLADSCGIEIATEAVEDTITTPSEEVSEPTNSIKRKNNIAVVNIQVSGVQFIQEAHGYDSVIKLMAKHIQLSDCNSIPYDEFQAKFSSRVRGWSSAFTHHQQCTFKVRLENTEKRDNFEDNLSASQQCPQETEKGPTEPTTTKQKGSTTTTDAGKETATSDSSVGDSAVGSTCTDSKRYSVCQLPVSVQTFLKAELGDISVSMLLSSASGLAELVQDELPPPPMESSFDIRNVSCFITEDQGSTNISMSSVATTRVIVPSLRVDRDSYGTFVIRQPEETAFDADGSSSKGSTLTSSGLNCDSELHSLRSEVSQLKQALELSSRALMDSKTENKSLKEVIRLLEKDVQQQSSLRSYIDTTAPPQGSAKCKSDISAEFEAMCSSNSVVKPTKGEGSPKPLKGEGSPKPLKGEGSPKPPKVGLMSNIKLGGATGLSRLSSFSHKGRQSGAKSKQ